MVRTSVGQTYRCRRVIIATSPQQARMFTSMLYHRKMPHFLISSDFVIHSPILTLFGVQGNEILPAIACIQGEHKKVSPMTFVDISAMHGDFCMKFYRTVKQSNIHFITKFG